MSKWFDRQVDAYVDRKIDKYVDAEFDKYLKGKVGDDTFQQLKRMARKGEPIDAETEAFLRDELGDNAETYKNIHNGVAELEQADSTLKQISRFLP